MIKALITQHLGAAMDKELIDAATPFTGTRKSADAGVYDPETGTRTRPPDVNYEGRGIFDNYSDFEIQATQIDITDVKLTCLQAEVTSAPIVDDVIIAEGISRRVQNVGQDPAHATWVIQLRGLGNVGR